MTREQFHSFIKLVRKMHDIQQQSYSAYNGNRNLVAQAKALEKKVVAKCNEFKPGEPLHYDWQERFIRLVKEVRAQQVLYYQTKYELELRKCQELERKLGEGIAWIERKQPQVFHELSTQATLL